MSERTYFSLKYAIPGYTFILLVIGINYAPLIKIIGSISTEVFAAFVGFLSLLGGSAIGFLVSQFWWYYFQSNGGIFGVEKYKKPLKFFCEKYKIIYPKKFKEQNKVTSIFDYVGFSEARSEDDPMLRLATSRWDMYHLLRAALWALGLGLLAGILLRIYFEYYLFNMLFWQLSNYKTLESAELWAQILIFFSVGVLACLLKKGSDWVITESGLNLEARIKSFKFKVDDLIRIFPTDLFSLTIVPGINQEKANVLKNKGIVSVKDLANTKKTSKELSENTALCEKVISYWIEKAKKIERKNLEH